MRGVILDLDGTILDSTRFWLDLGERCLGKMGIKTEPQLGQKLFSMSMKGGAAYIRETYLPYYSEAEILEGISREIGTFYAEEVEAKAGAADFLKKLADEGIPAVIATATDRPMVEAALERLGLLPYIRRIFTSTETGDDKHSPTIYLQAASAIDETAGPGEFWVFEDGLFALETARQAGFRTVAVKDEVSLNDWPLLRAKSDVQVEDARDWLRFFDRVS